MKIKPCTIITFVVFIILCVACLAIMYKSLDYIWYSGYSSSDGTMGITPFLQCYWITTTYLSYWDCYTGYTSVSHGKHSGRLVYVCMFLNCVAALLSVAKMVKKINSTKKVKNGVDSSVFGVLGVELIFMIASLANECAVIVKFKKNYDLTSTKFRTGFFLAIVGIVLIIAQAIVYFVLMKVQKNDDMYKDSDVSTQGQVVAQPAVAAQPAVVAQPAVQAQPAVYAQPAGQDYSAGAPPQAYAATPQYPYAQQGM